MTGYKCYGCKATFRSIGLLHRHNRVFHYEANTTFQCPYANCGKKFHVRKGFIKHIAYHAKKEDPRPCASCFDEKHNEQIQCQLCDHRVTCKQALQLHKFQFHKTVRELRCELCDIVFKDRVKFQFHINTHYPLGDNDSYRCFEKIDDFTGICGENFPTKPLLQRHFHNKHTHVIDNDNVGKKICYGYPCCLVHEHLTYNFDDREKEYHTAIFCQYDDCARCYHSQLDFAKHLVKYHDQRHLKPYVCTEPGCDSRFAFLAGLKFHKRKHSPEYAIRMKRHEQRVKSLLAENDIQYEEEVTIDFDCIEGGKHKCARIDMVMYVENGVILLEVDEDQHNCGTYTVSCDVRRMSMIQESLMSSQTPPGKILFVRYNPCEYKVDGKRVKHSKKFNKVQEDTLVRFIKEWTFPDTEQVMFVKYLFYDMTNNVPDVINDPDYHEHIRQCVVL